MFFPPPLFYSFFILIMHFGIKYLSHFYSLDKPNFRKKHNKPIPQVGGLIFCSCFIIIGYFSALIPAWMLIGSLVSMTLGLIDDNYNINWYIKLIVQFFLVAYIAYIFWGEFTHLTFYHFTIPINQILLLLLFSIWFVGIYNAVNLIDGLDGLAGGFILLVCVSNLIIGNTAFYQINLIMCILLIGFLLFNQRPAKVFMGDAGSLFLGFYIAVMPLLSQELNSTSLLVLDITPSLIMASFLIADTSRVFFTRLLSGKSPMTADTIHFHHLVIQRSGSYLTTLFVIFFISILSMFFAILGDSEGFSQNTMLVHLSLLFIFILTPPAPTYAKFISRLIEPIYIWHKSGKSESADFNRTILVSMLLLSLICLMLYNIGYNSIFQWSIILSIILMIIFYLTSKNKSLFIPAIQIYIILFFLDLSWGINPGFFSKLIIILIMSIIFIFSFRRNRGFIINEYSALDLLITFIFLLFTCLYLSGLVLNIWLFLSLFSIWFSLGFILRRTIDIN